MSYEELPPGMHFVDPEEMERSQPAEPPAEEVPISPYEQALKDMAEAEKENLEESNISEVEAGDESDTQTEPEPETDTMPRELRDLLSIILHAKEGEMAHKPVTYHTHTRRGRMLQARQEQQKVTTFSEDDCAIRLVDSDNFENPGGKRAELIHPLFSGEPQTAQGYAMAIVEIVSLESMETDPVEANERSVRLNNVRGAKIEGNKTLAEHLFIGEDAKLRKEQLELIYEHSEEDVIIGDNFPKDQPIEELLVKSEPSESDPQQ